ncbi:TPA: hypothetical protein DCW38_00600 [candidate division WOR-3 bacterium]|jgi:glycosyltransferase involved in cell wall biosynthesis|uniref:Glycosyltransferase n=1 Tax=candidate division WOR-3 bacterium TaxID=2052148 RepID=A0A350H806_UNCW3|nr:hypothetical protein [candidate division WOR-3 bacterium]
MLTKDSNILALCTTGYFNDRGCHVRILQVTEALAKRNSITVCAYSTGRNINSQRIIRIKKIFKDETDYIGFNIRKIILDISLLILTYKIVENERIDRILCFTHEAGILGFLLKRTAGIEYDLDYQGSLSKELMKYNYIFRLPIVKELSLLIERAIEHSAERVIYNTKFSFEESKKKRKELFEDGLSVFDSNISKAEQGEGGLFNVLWIGVMTEVQGFAEFLNMAERLLNNNILLKITVIGFPLPDDVRKRFEKFGERMHFAGKIDMKMIPHYVSEADLCISTKVESTEGNSKLHIYKEYGRDILAIRTKASEEILRGENLVDSYKEMERTITERIKNADGSSS